MEPFVLKSAKTTLPAQTKQATLLATLIDSPESKSVVFGVVRILGVKTEAREQIAGLIEETLERLSQSLTEEMNAPRRFEQILQALNQDIANRAETTSRIPLSDFQAVVGLMWDGQLFLSGIGSLTTLFLHRKSKKRYTVYDLDAQFGDEDQSWQKPFVTVLDGEVGPGDVFYLATRVSAREVSAAELQDILVTLPPSGALKRVTQHLGVDTNYAAVCFHAHVDEPSSVPKKTNPMTSLSMLGDTKAETESLLEDQRPEFGKLLHRFSSPMLQKLSAPGTSGVKSIVLRTLRMILQILIAVVAVAAKLLKYVALLFWKLAHSFFAATRDQNKREELRSRLSGARDAARNRYASMSKSARIGSLIGVIVLIAVIGSVSLYRSSKVRTEEQEAFDTIASHIEEKISAAEASLIYDNTDQARTLLAEATTLLESLPRDQSSLEEEADRLADEIANVWLGLQKITAVSPTTLASLDDASGGSFTSLMNIGGTLYGFTNGGEVHAYSPLSESLTAQSATFGTIGVPRLTTTDEDEQLFVDGDNALGRFNPENSTLNPVVSGIDNLNSVEDIFLYNDNVYALTAAGEQILKMRAQGDGFEAGTSWITSRNSELDEARAVAIDGDVYVLTSSDILIFTSGREGTLDLDIVDPALSDPIDLWTEFENDFLYVFEPSASRVVVFNKDGELVTQYMADELEDARAMIVNEEDRTITIATSSALMQWEMTHF